MTHEQEDHATARKMAELQDAILEKVQHESEALKREVLRDHFAGCALTGLTGYDPDACAEAAYRFADAMLKVRGENRENREK